MITIFSETHRETCLYKSRIMDQNVYDQQIEKYFQFVQNKAKAKKHSFIPSRNRSRGGTMKEIQLITKYIDENWHYEDYEVSPSRSASELLLLWGSKDFSYGFYKQNEEEWVIHDETIREVVKVIDDKVVHLRFE